MIYREASEFQNIYMTSWPYHIDTISLSESISFLRISMQILWALVAHRLGWLIAPTATAATAAPSVLTWSDTSYILFIHTQHIYTHLFIFVIIFMRHHGINKSVWSVHFLKNLCRLPVSQRFCMSHMYVICVCVMFACVWTQCDKLHVQNKVYPFQEVQDKGLSWV